MQEIFSEAAAILTCARAQFLVFRGRLGAAQSSVSLGNIFSMQINYSEATAVLTDARVQFIEIGYRMGDTGCSASLGAILRRRN